MIKNCHEFHQAEEWLKEQALALGWAKAAKVAGRSTLQGLIAVTTDPKTAAMIEVNCETDFVAKNSAFQDVVVKAANACFAIAKEQTNFSDSIAKVIDREINTCSNNIFPNFILLHHSSCIWTTFN